MAYAAYKCPLINISFSSINYKSII